MPGSVPAEVPFASLWFYVHNEPGIMSRGWYRGHGQCPGLVYVFIHIFRVLVKNLFTTSKEDNIKKGDQNSREGIGSVPCKCLYILLCNSTMVLFLFTFIHIFNQFLPVYDSGPRRRIQVLLCLFIALLETWCS